MKNDSLLQRQEKRFLRLGLNLAASFGMRSVDYKKGTGFLSLDQREKGVGVWLQGRGGIVVKFCVTCKLLATYT